MGAWWVAHYIDDFITTGAPDSLECQENATVEPEKDEGPATVLPFLGTELDSIAPSASRQTAMLEGGTEFMEESTQLQKEGITLYSPWSVFFLKHTRL